MSHRDFSARTTGYARRLPARQHLVLWAVSEGRVQRGLTDGGLEPYLLDGRDVVWPLRGLLMRGPWVMLHPLGPPMLTARAGPCWPTCPVPCPPATHG